MAQSYQFQCFESLVNGTDCGIFEDFVRIHMSLAKMCVTWFNIKKLLKLLLILKLRKVK